MTVTQVRQMATDTPPKPPCLSVPTRRKHRPTPDRHTKSTTDRHSKSATDISEDDLGIFEDDAECDDLTDSEGDLDPDKVTDEVQRAQALAAGDEWNGPQEEGVDTPSGQVKIEVSISRRSKAEYSKPTLTEVSLTLTPRSDRSEESYQGFRAKTNTPAGNLSERSEYGAYERIHTKGAGFTLGVRQSQGGGSASREAMYQQALTLMSQRCVSVVHASLPTPLPSPYHRPPPIPSPVIYPLLHPPAPGQLPANLPGPNPSSPRRRAAVPRGSKSVPTTRRGQHHGSSLVGSSHHQEPVRGRYHNHRVIYVNQSRPSPMPPLKAWRGFSGNVYFEPIKVKSVSQPPGGVTVNPQPMTSPVDAPTPGVKGQQNAKRTPVTSSETGVTSDGSLDGLTDITYAHSLPAGASFKSQFKVHKSGLSSKGTTGPGKPHNKMIVDKGSVFSNNFDNLMNSMSDDIEWIVGHQQSTGSLFVQAPAPVEALKGVPPPSRGGGGPSSHRENNGSNNNNKKFQYNRERICRGSVAHRAFPARDPNSQDPTEIASVFMAKSMSSSTPRLSPLRADNNKSPEKEITKDNKANPTEGTANGKLPPLDSSKAKTSNNAKNADDPLSSIALEQMKSSEHHPHPKDKPYVKYSKTQKQSNN